MQQRHSTPDERRFLPVEGVDEKAIKADAEPVRRNSNAIMTQWAFLYRVWQKCHRTGIGICV
jgi:hypothetical protein